MLDIVSCNGESDGNIDVTITGGNPAYTTMWSNGASTEDLVDIPAGDYKLNVTDQKMCKDSVEISIVQPTPIVVSFQTKEVSCIDQHDGAATALPVGGNGGYSYTWTNGTTTALNENLYGQDYSVTVTDILGCTGEGTVTIPHSLSACVNPVNTFTPNGDAYNDRWVIDNMDLYPDAEVQIFNKWGNLLFKSNGIYNAWDGVVNGVKLPSEVYYYIINLNYQDRKPLTGNITIIR
jgi:gliding motility-associated-like protein